MTSAAHVTNLDQSLSDGEPVRSRQLLFATSRATPAAASLQRALSFADLLDAELHVLQVVPEQKRVLGLLPAFSVGDVQSDLELFLASARTLSAWCAGVMGNRFVDERLVLRVGSFIEEVSFHARELGASMLIVPADEASGSRVTALVRATELPVFVARSQAERPTIVAAVDFGERTMPVLRGAVRLGRRIGAAVVAVHNFAPAWMQVARAPRGDRNERVVGSRAYRLQRAQRRFALQGAVVSNMTHAVDAIVGEAHARNADTIIVGTHARSRLGRMVRKSVAVQVIDRAQRSVLVLPVGEGTPIASILNL